MRVRGATALLREFEPLVIIAFFSTAIFLNWHIVIGVLPRYAVEFGVSLAAAGLLISVFALARMLLSFPSGAFVDRIGRRPMLILGGMITAAGSLGSGLVPGFDELVLMRFGTGAGGAIAITAQMTVLADISTERTRARLMSFNDGIVSIGIALGPVVGGALAATAGLRVPFYLAAALTLTATCWAALRIPETRGRASRTTMADAEMRRPSIAGGLRTILSDRDFVMINVVAFGSFFTRFGTVFMLLPLLAYSERIGLSLTEYGIMAGAMAGLQGLLLPVAGILADTLGRKALIVPSTLLTGLALIALGLAPTRELFLAGVASYALAIAINGPAPAAYLADVALPHLRGLSMGTYRTVGDFAGLIAPIVLGAVAAATPHPGLAIAANGGLVIVLGAAFGFFAREPARGKAGSRAATILEEPVTGP